jgi:hypothetical protein
LLKKLSVPREVIDSELNVIKPFLESQQRKFKIEKDNFFVNRDIFRAEYVLPEAILGVYEWCPTILVNDGFDPLLLQKMEVGYDKENNRIMYPLRDLYGNLAGFSGGLTPRSKWRSSRKYMCTKAEKRADGKWIDGDYGSWFDERFPDYRCENHDFLWNFDSVYPRILAMSDPNATVYVVEGFKACLWMIQSGLENTVALMGSYISNGGKRCYTVSAAPLPCSYDSDDAGRKAALRVGKLLQRPMFWHASK